MYIFRPLAHGTASFGALSVKGDATLISDKETNFSPGGQSLQDGEPVGWTLENGFNFPSPCE